MVSKDNKLKMMEDGNITKTLFKLGTPMVICMLVMALYNVVDSYFVSNLGVQQSGAVSVAFPLSLYFSGLGLTFGVGGASYISRLLGARNKEKANQVASVAFFSATILGFLLMLIITFFLKATIKSLGATESILPYAMKYGKIFIISTFFSTINITSGNIAIAQGAGSITLKSSMAGAILNILLDPLLINVFNLGVIGASIATLISQIITTILYLIFFFGKNKIIQIKISNFKPSFDIYKHIIKVGAFMFLLQFLTGYSMSKINNASKCFGDPAVAAMGLVLRIVTLGTNVVFGFMKGYQPLVGFNYGAKNYKRVKEATKIAIIWSTLYCIIWSLVVMVFSEDIMSLMIKDKSTIEIGTKALRINTLLFFTFGFQFTFATLYLAMGKALAGGLLNIGRQGLFLIPAILILPTIFKLDGIIIAQPVADIISTLITIPFTIHIINILDKKLLQET